MLSILWFVDDNSHNLSSTLLYFPFMSLNAVKRAYLGSFLAAFSHPLAGVSSAIYTLNLSAPTNCYIVLALGTGCDPCVWGDE